MGALKLSQIDPQDISSTPPPADSGSLIQNGQATEPNVFGEYPKPPAEPIQQAPQSSPSEPLKLSELAPEDVSHEPPKALSLSDQDPQDVSAAPPLPDDKKSGLLAGVAGIGAGVGGAMEVAGRFMGNDTLTEGGKSTRESGETLEKQYEPTGFAGKAAKLGVGLAPILAPAAAGFAIGGPVGAAVGLGGGLLAAYGLSVGDLYNTLVGLKVDPERAKKYAAGYSVPIALLETLPPVHLASKLLGKPAESAVVKGLARRLVEASAVGGAEQAAVGSAVGGLQEKSEADATGQTMEQRGGLKRVADTAEQFGALGVGFGALGGIHAPRPKGEIPPTGENAEPPPKTPPGKPTSDYDQPVPDFIAAQPETEQPKPSAEQPRIFKVAEPETAAEVPPETKTSKFPDTIGDLPPDAQSTFRKEISKATGEKGVQVYGHGDGATYDPLVGHMTVGDDVPADQTTIQKSAALIAEKPSDTWKTAKVEATLEDGSKIDVDASTAAGILSKKIRNAMTVLECLA